MFLTVLNIYVNGLGRGAGQELKPAAHPMSRVYRLFLPSAEMRKGYITGSE
jgi:hypothetical protein